MTYIGETNPPYQFDKLTTQNIMNAFTAEPALAYNRDRLILIGGANLVLRNIVEVTPDIDLLVPSTLLGTLRDGKAGVEELDPPISARHQGAVNTSLRFKAQGGAWVTMTDSLGDGHFPMSYDALDAEARRTETVQGIRCLPLATLMMSKQTVGREKDLRHLQAIREHLIGF